MDSLPKLSICTAVWNGLDFTKNFVESIKTNQSFDYELVILDNGSDVDVSKYISEQANRYYRFDQNQGFCRGFNKSAELATNDFILLINNDTILPNENWWKELYREFCELDNCGVIFPCVNNILSPINNRSEKGSAIIKSPKWKLPLASGCALAIRKSLFFDLGGFDESYITSAEDLDLQFKIWEAGYEVYITERVFIEHIGKASSQKLENQKQLWSDNFLKFKKNGNIESRNKFFKRKHLAD